MEGLFSEWVQFHKCLLTGGCSIFDISNANCTIDLLILIIGGSSGFAIKRWIKGEKIFIRKDDPGFTGF